MRGGASVVHLNVVDFAAAVAMAKDRTLEDKAFVIAGAASGRAIVLGLSPRAREEGLAPGMSLEGAERRVRGLLVVQPDPGACAQAGAAMEAVAARYAPLIQNDSGGHLYLDLSGTQGLWGPAIDCAVRIRNEIAEGVGVEASVAVARNKLVAKVAARSIRPAGIARIREGEEASFLAPQDVGLLLGVGPAIARILEVTGIREIGELAALSNAEALALLGKKGLALRDAALGVDASPVAQGGLRERVIQRRADFAEDEIEGALVRAARISLVEDAGLELRMGLLAAGRLKLGLRYADGFATEAEERPRAPVVLDADLIALADRAFARAGYRRVRLRSLVLELSSLAPAQREPDLFIPEGPSREERLQTAVDGSRRRYGAGAVTRGSALASPLPTHAP